MLLDAMIPSSPNLVYLKTKANENGGEEKKDPKTSAVIGLCVGSRVFYTHRNTVKGISFRINGQPSYIDSNNDITVYLLERDGDLFALVLKYLTTGRLNLPPFATHAPLWRDLRQEADYFQLKDLKRELEVTHACSNPSLGRGVFHWLLSRGDKENAHSVLLGALRANGDFVPESPVYARKLLQHRPAPGRASPQALKELASGSLKILDPIKGPAALWPGGESIVIQLSPKVQLKPTHISLRVAHHQLQREEATLGFVECSQDGIYWKALGLELMPTQSSRTVREIAGEVAAHVIGEAEDEADGQEMLLHFAEKYLRRAWKVQSGSEFFRYFRFKGASLEQPYTCMAGCGLEFYGDIQEE